MVYLPNEYREVPPLDLLSWLFDNNSVDTEKDILIDAANPETRSNTRQAISLTRKLIAGFKAAGLETGDVVCVHAFNSILYPLLYYSIIGAGGVFVASNPAYKTLELEHLISITSPKFFITEAAGLLDIVLPTTKTAIPLAETLAAINDEQTARSTIAVLQSTSGTTGVPKVAASSHYALVASGIAMRESTVKLYAVTRLIPLPLFHSFGASFVQISAFHCGETACIVRKFDVEEFMGALQHLEISEIAVVPAMLTSIIRQRISPLALRTLRRIWCAGTPLSGELRKATYELLHQDAIIIISQVWGLTEFGRITTSDHRDRGDEGSVGRLLPNVEARIVDAQGTEILDEGQSGKFQIRGPSVTSHYSKCPLETAEAFNDGWLKTGDYGYVKGNKVYIIGRIKELIKVRGWQVLPTEIENVLLTHPFIVDAAVIGVTLLGRDSNDELPRAYVVTSGGKCRDIDLLGVVQYVKERLASFKALDGGVEFVYSIPRNHNGKILRQVLRERAMAEVASHTTIA
ncbi:AMP-binding enzyme [Aureobasidium namibiae CBS 147.97]|uniref:AMP-binding enzyme n=1 Tax=Aureobasidium namibiae CBS 147.97 TaxID=1043004 RepID=A0A074X9G9_9PEZI